MAVKLLKRLKREYVFLIAAALALLSAFFVPPSGAYLSYIDFRVLTLLFCLMFVVAGFNALGVFKLLGGRLLKRAKNTRQLSCVLVLLSFFSSMVITNDVALITFVPFAIMIYTMADKRQQLIPVIVMQTIAANLGSMFTPVGNPQNLYLYTKYQLDIVSFLKIMGPLTAAALVMILLFLSISVKEPIQIDIQTENERIDRKRLFMYSLLFAACIASVLHMMPYGAVLALVLASGLIFGRPLFRHIDYFLLLTFICFFIFIGNMGNIDAVKQLLGELACGRELALGVLSSQCISNVPAAILLSGFTERYVPLLIGVNIGGLGTLIASLASLISYKCYANSEGASKGSYLFYFTVMNFLFLGILIAVSYFLSGGFG